MYRHLALVFLCLILTAKTSFGQQDISSGTFWQITDIHYEPLYSVDGNPALDCRNGQVSGGKLGEFGNHRCESPLKLVQSALQAMKQINNNPDFIIWTGDSVASMRTADDEKRMLDIMTTVTSSVAQTFPNASVYPVLGNHDSFPVNQMPADSKGFYQKVLDEVGWTKMLTGESKSTFSKGGYYTELIKPGMRLIGLNTNLYFVLNELVRGNEDPAGQFAWLDQTLTLAKNRVEKVIIISHIPPGVLPVVWDSFQEAYNKRYTELLLGYADTIKTQIYGHEHRDSIRLFYDSNGVAVNSAFMAPSLTPNYDVNPSVRLYKYNRDTASIMDIQQYHLNLTQANIENKANWTLEYTATQAYGLPDLSLPSLQKLVDSFKPDDSSTFSDYYKFFLSGNIEAEFNKTIKEKFICSATKVDFDEYYKCIGVNRSMVEANSGFGIQAVDDATTLIPTTENPSSVDVTVLNVTRHHPTPHHHHKHKPVPRYMFYVIGALVVVVVLLFIIITILCLRRRGRYVMVQPRYVLIS